MEVDRTGLGPIETVGTRFRCTITAARGEEIGHVEFATEDGCLDVRYLELGEGKRGWGHGSEAVRLLEQEAKARGVFRARAGVPPANGLALYFWLRLGYRPQNLRQGAEVGRTAPVPKAPPGTDRFIMVRELKGEA